MGSSQSINREETASKCLNDSSETSCSENPSCERNDNVSNLQNFYSLIAPLETSKELETLIGKLQHLPRSAQRLFSLSEAYLAKNVCTHIQPADNCLQKLSVNDISLSDESEVLSSTDVTTRRSLKKSLFIPLINVSDLPQPQTFSRWKHLYTVHNVYPFICKRKPNVIYVQPIDVFPEFVQDYKLQKGNLILNLFNVLQGFMQIFFSGYEVLVCPNVEILPSDNIETRKHTSTGQNQLCVNDIYPKLKAQLQPDGIAIIGLSWTDIYPRGFNFTLGEASISHHAAVVSFGRFETKDFNADINKDVEEINGEIVWKLLKTITHETCHLLGLEHCLFFSCAMNESSSVPEAMQQPLFLCPVCLRKLQQACQFNVLERYEQLHSFLKAIVTQHAECQKLTDAMYWLENCIDYLLSTD